MDSKTEVLLREMRNNNLKTPPLGRISAELINATLTATGDDSAPAINEEVPGQGGGTNLFVALIYSNLLLAERVRKLEEVLDNG